MFDRRVLAQESNSIRLTAIFGFLTISFALLLTLLFNPTNRALILLSLGHLPLAFVAAFLSVVSSTWSKWTIGIFAVQALFDFTELILRITPLTAASFLELRTIGELLFILINVALLVISIVYVIFIYRYITVFDAAMEAHLIEAGGADEGDYQQKDANTGIETGAGSSSSSQYLDPTTIGAASSTFSKGKARQFEALLVNGDGDSGLRKRFQLN